ncbi:MAG: hypothetical protein V2I33_08805 [Kangiellaceae bacterium]|jgi:hypothetical protein|nr:hypothetical protein [Kangiellaceae bacterium]
MSDKWQKVERLLRELEADEEFDLFAIGYVIPQVALAHEDASSDDNVYNNIEDLVESSMIEDNLDDNDKLLVRQILAVIKQQSS